MNKNIYGHFRKHARNFLLNLLSIDSIPQPGIHILNGHFLSLDNRAPGRIFRDQLEMLKSKKVHFINFDSAVKLIWGKEFTTDKCLVAFTFDDGFEECFTKIRPVLNEMNIKAGFFINPGFIDGGEAYRKKFKEEVVFTDKSPMNWEQIKILKEEGHIIGAHTVDHLMLNIPDKKILEYQIGESKKRIEEILNGKCEYFAFPYGRPEHISEPAIEIAEKYFKYIFSQSNYRHYFSFGERVINRRHFESDWPYRHVIYFLKNKKI